MSKSWDILIVILFILSVIVFIWFIFGGSPTFEQTILVLALTLLFTFSTKSIKNEARLNVLEQRFNKLAVDFTKYLKNKKI